MAGHFRYLSHHAALKSSPENRLNHAGLTYVSTFDDAYADFYYHVFPLLQKFSSRRYWQFPRDLFWMRPRCRAPAGWKSNNPTRCARVSAKPKPLFVPGRIAADDRQRFGAGGLPFS